METKKRVLVVDDERAILRVLSVKLRVSGFDVVTAAGGEEALKLIDSAKPEVLLLDIVMPGMDGFEVLRRLRSFSTLPVIVFSARPDNATKALSLGANDFLAKPFNVDDVVKRIHGLLDHGGR